MCLHCSPRWIYINLPKLPHYFWTSKLKCTMPYDSSEITQRLTATYAQFFLFLWLLYEPLRLKVTIVVWATCQHCPQDTLSYLLWVGKFCSLLQRHQRRHFETKLRPDRYRLYKATFTIFMICNNARKARKPDNFNLLMLNFRVLTQFSTREANSEGAQSGMRLQLKLQWIVVQFAQCITFNFCTSV